MTGKRPTVDGERSLGGNGTAHSGEKDNSSRSTINDLGRLVEDRSEAVGLSDCPPEESNTEDRHDDDLRHEEVSKFVHAMRVSFFFGS
jgi:hypothetical protein